MYTHIHVYLWLCVCVCASLVDGLFCRRLIRMASTDGTNEAESSGITLSGSGSITQQHMPRQFQWSPPSATGYPIVDFIIFAFRFAIACILAHPHAHILIHPSFLVRSRLHIPYTSLAVLISDWILRLSRTRQATPKHSNISLLGERIACVCIGFQSNSLFPKIIVLVFWILNSPTHVMI